MKDKIITVISVIAFIEFFLGAVLIEGGLFGLGSLAMAMPLVFFTLIMLKYGR